MQKILNVPTEFVNEMLEGILEAYPTQLKAVDGDNHALVRADAPVSGKVIAINDSLSNSPELINSDPYNTGWLLEIELTETATDLLTPVEYGQITA